MTDGNGTRSPPLELLFGLLWAFSPTYLSPHGVCSKRASWNVSLQSQELVRNLPRVDLRGRKLIMVAQNTLFSRPSFSRALTEG